MEHVSKFRRLALFLYWAVTAGMLGLVIVMAVFYVMPDLALQTLIDNAPKGLPILTDPSVAVIYALLLVGTVSVAVQLFIMWHMRAFLGLYAEGQALSRACAGRISRIGVGLLVFPLTRILYHMASSALLTLGNPEGQRQLAIGISSGEIAGMVGGGMLLLVGVAMLEASRQADENRSFV